MKLRIRKGLFAWQIINENNATVSKIINRKLFGAEKRICDSAGNTIYTTNIVNLPVTKDHWNNAESKRFMVYKNEQPVAAATFNYAIAPERTRLQILIHPPQIEKMNVDTPYGVIFIIRERDNSVTIIQNGERLGTITSFFSFKKRYITTYNDKFDDTFLSAIYMLIEYMMHEDDLIIV